MGLDVKTYGNIKLSKNEEDADFSAFVTNEAWSSKIKNLQEGKLYSGDIVFIGVSYTYSEHRRFREKLIKLVGREDLLDEGGKIRWDELSPETPFYDLINFADNDGCLDWEISATIYADFKKYDEKARLEMDEYDYHNFETWEKTFKSAKNGGVVVFS